MPSLLILLVVVVVVAIVIAVSVSRRKPNGSQPYPPPYPQQPPMAQPYPPQNPQYGQQLPYAPQQAPFTQPAAPSGYQPQSTNQYVTAANGYQLLLPQFGPEQKAIISVAVVAQGKVYFRAMPNGTGMFGGGLDLVSGRRQPHEDVLTSIRRILAEETGGWTGRPLATVGNAQWDLGNGQEQEVCYAVLLDPQPNNELPAAGMATWADRAGLAPLRGLGARAQVTCQFADAALSAAGV